MAPRIRTRYGTRFEFDVTPRGQIILANKKPGSPDGLRTSSAVMYYADRLLAKNEISKSERQDIRKDSETARCITKGTRLEFYEDGTGEIILSSGAKGSPIVRTRGDALTCVTLSLQKGWISEQEAMELRTDIEVSILPSEDPMTHHAISHSMGMPHQHTGYVH